MKKFTALLIVLFVAASLFAATGLTVKAGGAFDLFFLRTDYSDGDAPYRQTYSGNGFGFDLGVQYDIGRNLMVYADYNMVFPYDFVITNTDKSGERSESETFRELLSIFEKAGIKVRSLDFFLDASVGAAYRFDLGSVKLAVGGGAFCDLLFAQFKANIEADTEERADITFFNVGVSTLIDAKYMVTENIGVNLTVMPQLGIYSDRAVTIYENGKKDEDESIRLDGVGLSFVMPVTIGASYSF